MLPFYSLSWCLGLAGLTWGPFCSIWCRALVGHWGLHWSIQDGTLVSPGAWWGWPEVWLQWDREAWSSLCKSFRGLSFSMSPFSPVVFPDFSHGSSGLLKLRKLKPPGPLNCEPRAGASPWCLCWLQQVTRPQPRFSVGGASRRGWILGDRVQWGPSLEVN